MGSTRRTSDDASRPITNGRLRGKRERTPARSHSSQGPVAPPAPTGPGRSNARPPLNSSATLLQVGGERSTCAASLVSVDARNNAGRPTSLRHLRWSSSARVFCRVPHSGHVASRFGSRARLRRDSSCAADGRSDCVAQVSRADELVPYDPGIHVRGVDQVRVRRTAGSAVTAFVGSVVVPFPRAVGGSPWLAGASGGLDSGPISRRALRSSAHRPVRGNTQDPPRSTQGHALAAPDALPGGHEGSPRGLVTS